MCIERRMKVRVLLILNYSELKYNYPTIIRYLFVQLN